MNEKITQTKFKTIKDFPLRERKYAKTKISLAQEFMDRMKTQRFSNISIKDVCEKVEVSEGTFYNYFPHKMHLVCFFNKFTVLKLLWEVGRKSFRNDVEIIEYAFDCLADNIGESSLFYEIISLYASERIKPDDGESLTEAEKVLGLPDCPGIENVQLMTLENFFAKHVANSQKNGLLKKGVSSESIVILLMSTLVGLPLAIDINHFGSLKGLYKTQLSMLWKGLGV